MTSLSQDPNIDIDFYLMNKLSKPTHSKIIKKIAQKKKNGVPSQWLCHHNCMLTLAIAADHRFGPSAWLTSIKWTFCPVQLAAFWTEPLCPGLLDDEHHCLRWLYSDKNNLMNI